MGTTWQVSDGTIFFWSWAFPPGDPLCYDLYSDHQSSTPNGAYDSVIQYINGGAGYCSTSQAQRYGPTVRNEDCNAIAPQLEVFDGAFMVLPSEIIGTTTGNYRSSSMLGKKVWGIKGCSVTAPLLDGSGTWQVKGVWRSATCAIGMTAIPDGIGGVLCIEKRDPVDAEQDGTPDCDAGKGNPINLATGNKFQTETDYSDASGRFVFKRYYNSSLGASDNNVGFSDVWRTSYSALLVIDSNARGTWVNAKRPDGAVIHFVKSGASYVPVSPDIRARLSAVIDANGQVTSWNFYDSQSNRIEVYSAMGALVKFVWLDGYAVTFSIGNSGYPNYSKIPIVTDSFGRTLTFGINPNGRPTDIATITAGVNGMAGSFQVARYYYGGVDLGILLRTVELPYGSKSYWFDEQARLTQISDGKTSYSYDDSGRAVSTSQGAGAMSVVVTPTVNVDGSVTNVLNDMGKVYTQHFAKVNGKLRLVSQSNPAGSGCAASTALAAYDANGNKAVIDDFNGTRMCLAHDLSKNLPLVSVEGASSGDNCAVLTATGAALPSAARKTTTQWHPDFELQTKVAQPLKITTRVYNGRPDPFNGGVDASCAAGAPPLPGGNVPAVVCKVVEQATTDADGSQGFSAALDSSVLTRTSLFTYNANGQMLTSADPLGNVTRYTYYAAASATNALGDMASVRSPKGFTTSFTGYDLLGNPTGVTLPNGSTRSFTYSTTGKVLTSTDLTGTTTYTYNIYNKVTKISPPSGDELTIASDDGNRVAGITDKAGNSVTYTLDAAGNRLAEQFKDSAGSLKRRVDRTFDALGRLQSLIGG